MTRIQEILRQAREYARAHGIPCMRRGKVGAAAFHRWGLPNALPAVVNGQWTVFGLTASVYVDDGGKPMCVVIP